ncbi:MAG: DUF4845 domain-containing protein [Burkholderiales bacterium]|nr:DUF4845 domain-containing protein [Burkholderiales bacterium]
MRKQNGLSLVTMLLGAIVLGLALLLVIQLIPVYTEYFSVKSVLKQLANEQAGAPPAEIRESFVKRASIQDISSVKPDDLDITQDANGTSISVTYQAKVHLVANVSLLFDFSAQAQHGAPAQ